MVLTPVGILFRLVLLVVLPVMLGPRALGACQASGRVEFQEGIWWCEGRIHKPEGYPEAESPKAKIRYAKAAAKWSDRESFEEPVTFGKDGSFRIPIPKGAAQIWLILEADKTPILPASFHVEREGVTGINLRLELSVLWRLTIEDPVGHLLEGAHVARAGYSSTRSQPEKVAPGVFEWNVPVETDVLLMAFGTESQLSLHDLLTPSEPGRSAITIRMQEAALVRARLMIPDGYQSGKLQMACYLMKEKEPDHYMPRMLPLPLAPDEYPRRNFLVYNKLRITEGPAFEIYMPSGRNLRFILATEFGLGTRYDVKAMAPGEVSGVLEIPIEVGPFVEIQVVGADGIPVVGAQVRGTTSWATHNSLTPWYPTTPPYKDGAGLFGNKELMVSRGYHHASTTNDQGRCVFRIHERIQSISVEVLSSDDAEPMWQLFNDVPCTQGVARLVLDPQPSTLSGIVVDHAGNPVEDFIVRLSPKGHRPGLSPFKPHLFDEPYVNPNLTWETVFGPKRELYSFTLKPSRDSDVIVWGPPHAPVTDHTFVGCKGHFEIKGVPPGEWSVEVVASGHRTTQVDSLVTPQATAVKIRMNPLGQVNLTLIDNDGLAIEGQEVELYGPDPKTRISPQRHPMVTTDVDGRATWRDLAAGRYWINARGEATTRFNRLEFTLADEAILELTPEIYDLGHLRGRIDWEQEAYPVRIQLQRGNERPISMHEALLDRDFTFGPMRVGTYVVQATQTESWEQSVKIIPPQTVVIRKGETTDITLAPDPGYCSCSGVVTVNGKPASKGSLLIESTEGPKFSGKFAVRKDGAYLALLPRTGKYRFTYLHDPSSGARREAEQWAQDLYAADCVSKGIDLHVVMENR